MPFSRYTAQQQRVGRKLLFCATCGDQAVTKISASFLWFNKKVFPVLWFGFLGFITLLVAVDGGGKGLLPFIVFPIGLALFGYFLMKKLIWDLVDEVYDCGDALLVRYRGEEDRIPLSNIMNVNSAMNVRPPRVTLKLAAPSKFGDEIAFSPITQFTFNPFAKNKIVEDLIVRVDRARSGRVRSY